MTQQPVSPVSSPLTPTQTFLYVAASALVYLSVAGGLQLYTSVPWDGDTAYHAMVGYLIREHGILRAFPWTSFSWLANHYADKELLFHLLFLPFVDLSYVAAAKIVGTIAGAIMLLSLSGVLFAERVRLAAIWALIPLAASGYFTFRFALVRPHLLSIALALVILWASSRKRPFILMAAGAIYPWAYVAFWQLPLLLLLAAETSRLLSGERVQWKPAAAVLGGIALGVGLHPNAGNLLQFNWIVMNNVLFQNSWIGGNAEVQLGTELLPLTAGEWIHFFLVPAAMVIASLTVAWKNRRNASLPLAFALAALGFGILAARSARFSEYFVPFAVAAMALCAGWIPWRRFSAACWLVSLLYTATLGADAIKVLAKRGPSIPPMVAQVMRQNIPPKAQVFTTGWGYTGELMVELPERRFLVALDPTLFYINDPELFKLWYELPLNPRPGVARIIRERFGARYVVSEAQPQWRPFFHTLSLEPGVRILVSSGSWMVFDLGSGKE